MKKIYLNILTVVTLMSGCNVGDSAVVEGRVKVKGSAPHSYLVLEDIKTSKDLKISNASKFNLDKMQNSIIKAKVKLVKKALGPGFPAIVEIVEIIK